MAQKIMLVDDLDQTEAVETVKFSLRGETFEIDLSKANGDKLNKALSPYITAARKAAGPGPMRQRAPRGSAPAKPAGVDYKSIDNAGLEHRGRVTEEEARLVRDNLETANANRAREGQGPIDPNDVKMKKRYGF